MAVADQDGVEMKNKKHAKNQRLGPSDRRQAHRHGGPKVALAGTRRTSVLWDRRDYPHPRVAMVVS